MLHPRGVDKQRDISNFWDIYGIFSALHASSVGTNLFETHQRWMKKIVAKHDISMGIFFPNTQSKENMQ